MGGIGSGRQSGSGRHTIEACRAIDVNRLNKEGCLRPGWVGRWQWTEEGEQVAVVDCRAETHRFHLSYRIRIQGGEWQSVDEPIDIVRTACRFGGTRPFFICPGMVNGVVCGSRVVKLHGAGRYFLCRHCYRLSYASQSEGSLDRTHRRVRKIRRRLGGSDSLIDSFVPKPKGMWQRTYIQLRDKIVDDEMRAETMFEIQGQQLLARLDRHRDKGQSRKRSFWT